MIKNPDPALQCFIMDVQHLECEQSSIFGSDVGSIGDSASQEQVTDNCVPVWCWNFLRCKE